jgi:DNA polymerase
VFALKITDPTQILEIIKKMVENGDPKEQIIKTIESFMPTDEDRLKDKILECKNCGLHNCNHTLFTGITPNDIMFIGEAPGSEEEKQGIPFVGPAGQIFDNMLEALAKKINPRWDRDSVYITNVIKCRPTDTGTSNRTPDLKEIAACRPILNKEIEIVKPKLIVCVGGTAASTLIHPGFKITEEHGKFFGDNPKMIAIYHPSYILRRGEGTPEGKKLKKDVWQDMLLANEYLDSIGV